MLADSVIGPQRLFVNDGWTSACCQLQFRTNEIHNTSPQCAFLRNVLI